MNILQKSFNWLRSLIQKENHMSDATAADSTTPVTTTTVVPAEVSTDTATVNTAMPTPSHETETISVPVVTPDETDAIPDTSSDKLLEQVKALLLTVGHDVEDEFDEIVALAKKLVCKK